MTEPSRSSVEIGDRSLSTSTMLGGRPTIVLLHDGLGSIAQWRSVPQLVADHTGSEVFAYDRSGHGSSRPTPDGPWPADWLEREADVLEQLLDLLGIERPILVGHSDGGSIALIHAMRFHRAAGVVAIAAHSWVEDAAVDHIAGLRGAPAAVIAGLSVHHKDARAVFDAWSGVWTSDAFRTWDLRPTLAAIDVPVLVVQGSDDEYATDAQAVETARAIGDNADHRLVPGGHLLHHDHPEVVAELVAQFATRIEDDGSS
ncbi:MAG: alpha/beta fold hydrolase [Acidimicrobiales bacterium]